MVALRVVELVFYHFPSLIDVSQDCLEIEDLNLLRCSLRPLNYLKNPERKYELECAPI